DSFGLVTFDTKVRDRVPPRQGPGHLRMLMDKLEGALPGGETGLAGIFHELAETMPRRSLVIIISDPFDDPGKLVAALKHFRYKKHEVIVLHTLDTAEVTFPFDDVTRIEDMENNREVVSDPRAFRKQYLEELARFLEIVRTGCTTSQIDYVLAETNQPF